MDGNISREIAGLICFVFCCCIIAVIIMSIVQNRKEIKEFIIKLFLHIMVFIILCVISYIPYKIFVAIFF